MRRRSGVLAVACAWLLVLAGCSAPALGPGGPDAGRADPDSDRLGWEDGYWHDDPLPVTPDDGLNESERDAVVARTMARVEFIRGREFTESVPVEVISRTEYQDRRGGQNGSATFEAWNNQVWEALFLVGEDTDVSAAFDTTLSTTVQGYYSSGDDEIVVVSDAETPTIDRGTLAHELVHALQDQHFGLGGNPEFQDQQLATDAVVEGDANAVQRRYEQRCGREWSCLPEPERSGGGTPSQFNMGVFVTLFTPYAAGQSFVERVQEDRGWEGVDALYEQFPASTEQVIHPDRYPDERPVNVTVRDRSNRRWNRFDLNRPRHDVVGEASIYAMFWANGAVEGDRSPYRYDHPLSTGWGGDAVMPYRNGDRFGYVWVTVWDTRADATEFVSAYRDLLANRSTRRPSADVYVIPESDRFGDAFRVTRSGRRVRVVNAPTVRALSGVGGEG